MTPSPPPPSEALEWARRRLLDWVGVASVSTEGRCLQEGADFTAALLREAGLEAEIHTTPGAPVVIGSRPAAPGRPTLLIYGHYDVQPADADEGWTSPPFVADERDGAIFGRGAGDNKGQLLAHVAAVRERILQDRLDVGVRFLVEGEEEIGSPHVGDAVRRLADRLDADVAVTSDAPVHDDGRPVVMFGVRGLLYLEIEIAGARADLHSGNRGGLAPMPAWELVRLLDSLRAADGRVAVAGFADAARPPTPAEERMLEELPDVTADLRREMGVERLPESAERDPWREVMFSPTLNLAGLDAGYRGPGAKTVIPRVARCKIDCRLVADQDPDAVFAAVERHVHSRVPQATVRRVAAVPPSATDPADPLARAVVDAVAAAGGQRPLLRPRLGGTTPDWIFTRILGIPSVLVPFGPPDMSHHAPDERMTLEALERGIRCSLEICGRLGQRSIQGGSDQ